MVLADEFVTGLIKRGKEVSVSLGQFALPNWRESIGEVRPLNKALTLLELVVEGLESCYQRTPDLFDLPILRSPLDHFEGGFKLPFELRSWDLIGSSGVASDLDVMLLISGTFHEIRDRLGDMRAALDVAVTSQLWIVRRNSGTFGFASPYLPTTLVEAGVLCRVRSMRNRGISQKSKSYRVEVADALGLRWGVGVSESKTLAEVGEMVGLTRERVRQIEQSQLWSSPTRTWGNPPVLQDLADQMIVGAASTVTSTLTGEQLSREDAVALLIAYGYAGEDFEGPWTIHDEIEFLGLRWSDLKSVAYRASDNLGFLSRPELESAIADQFPELVGELFDEVISQLLVRGDLPQGFVYVEKSGVSQFKNWVVRLLKVMGPQSISEIYTATERFCKSRLSGVSFPPRPVVAAFLRGDPTFQCEGELVRLWQDERLELTGVEKWFKDLIQSTRDSVISRTVIFEKAREAGMRHGTMMVYSSYSLFFKPCGRGCVTLTGMSPSSEQVEFAWIQGRAIQVPTVRGEIELVDGNVILPVQVGTDLLNTGVLSSTKEIRDLLRRSNFRLIFDGLSHGSTGFSRMAMFGFTTVLHEMGAQPGDEIQISFDLVEREATLSFINE